MMFRNWFMLGKSWFGLGSTKQSFRRRSTALQLELLEDRLVPATPGTLDPTFGTNGTVTFAVKQFSANHLFDIAVQDDGKIVAAGRTRGDTDTEDSVVTRFNVNGTVDTTFGVNGSKLVNLSGREEFHAVAVQSDGKI